MDQNHEHYHRPEPKEKWWKTPNGIVIIFFFLALGYFLITEHGAHMLPYLPWIILLICPFMHFFMHGSHGEHGGHQDHNHSNTDKDE